MKGKAKDGFKKKPKQSKQLLFDSEINKLQENYANIACDSINKFTDLPLSQKTLKGLNEFKFINPTEIQRHSIGVALQGRDVLGAAATGSGKTLAFLIPVLEHLFVNKWSRMDGTNAIIISPTRELAYQIFETLKKIGRYHDFSAGLIIGGKNLKFERTRMDQCNILICTPGRLLQHMDENPLFNSSTMEVLVLDEADRCLDMGFEQTLNAIIENFPSERQTLLFSATQTSTVKDLARLNLRDPVYVGYKQEKQSNGTTTMVAIPELLQQSYVVVALEDKITMLWSFIRNHLKQKIIVFLSSCKQVKYIFEIFCKLRPGTSLLALYGTLHQDRRIAIYNDFVRKSNVVLFATDIASRGLDFPAVNWVVQLDCPEDVTQYIHRAGRSARNKASGESLLVLLPSEEKCMAEELKKQKINIKHIHIDPKKLFSPRVKIEAFLAQFPELKASAQRAFLSYIKSVFLMKNKKVFNVLQVDFDAYAKSLGLAVTPRVRFLDRYLKRTNQQQSAQNESENSEDSNDEDDDVDDDDAEQNLQTVTQERSNAKSLDRFEVLDSEADSDDGDSFIRIKRANHDIQNADKQSLAAEHKVDEEDSLTSLTLPKKGKLITKTSLAKKIIKKKLQMNERVKFDEDGVLIENDRKRMQASLAKQYEEQESVTGGINIELSKQLMSEEDKYDKQRFRQLVKERHKKQKEKLKKQTAKHDVSDGDDNGDDMDQTDDNPVDLSWLPDPSNIYGGKSTKEAESSDETDDDDDEIIDDEPVTKKSKVTAKLTLNDAEAIAAQLLANSM